MDDELKMLQEQAQDAPIAVPEDDDNYPNQEAVIEDGDR